MYDIIFYSSTFFLSLMIISVAIDKRRFRNGVYFLIFLSIFALWAFLYGASQSLATSKVVIIAYLAIILIMTTVLPLTLIINGLIMIKKEGFSLAHILSLLFGIFIIGGEAAFIYYVLSYTIRANFIYISSIWLSGVVIYVSFVFLAFVLYSLVYSLLPHSTNYQYIVVLGCGLINGEKVSGLLKRRLDKAIKISKRNKIEEHFICSGGQGPDEKVCEAYAMKQYLLSQGIDEDLIILEDQSVNTNQNLQYSYNIIKLLDNNNPRLAFVTNNYHVLRTAVYSMQQKIKGDVIGSSTRMYFWPSAMIREFIALMKHYFIAFILFIILWTILVALSFM